MRKPSCKLGKDPTLIRNRTTSAMLCMDLKKNILKFLLPPSWHQKTDRWMVQKEARRKGPTFHLDSPSVCRGWPKITPFQHTRQRVGWHGDQKSAEKPSGRPLRVRPGYDWNRSILQLRNSSIREQFCKGMVQSVRESLRKGRIQAKKSSVEEKFSQGKDLPSEIDQWRNTSVKQ